jgi:septal ring factor EnvC (AmiA/AmiB activator)
MLVDKLKEKEQNIIELKEELIYSKREIDELNKEIKNLLVYCEEQKEMYRCQQEETIEIYQEDRCTAAAAMCCNEDYNELRMDKVRPIDRNGNMKK